MIVIGIDPGVQTGVAWFGGGVLRRLSTASALEVADFIRRYEGSIGRVVVEDSRMVTKIWNPRAGRASKAASMAMARSVGTVDGLCAVIEEAAKKAGVEFIGISPKDKGAKLNAQEFAEITGWTERSNQHERDAAMVAWRFR